MVSQRTRGVGDLPPESSKLCDLSPPTDDLLDLNEALDCLAEEDPQAAQFVKLRYFTGLSIEEAAEMVGLSRSAACEHWAYSRAWLQHRLKPAEGPAGD